MSIVIKNLKPEKKLEFNIGLDKKDAQTVIAEIQDVLEIIEIVKDIRVNSNNVVWVRKVCKEVEILKVPGLEEIYERLVELVYK